jgi:hypothetical protein
MYPSTAISYELAQARITDLRHQARRASAGRAARAARTAQAESQLRKPLVHGRFHFRAAGRHRAITAGS